MRFGFKFSDVKEKKVVEMQRVEQFLFVTFENRKM